jgi:hypothetical protein
MMLMRNAFDISETTCNTLLAKEKVRLSRGVTLKSFETVAEIYRLLMLQRNIAAPIIASLAQDESPIIKTVSIAKNDTGKLHLIGFCGLKKQDGMKHVCFGSDMEFCESTKISSYEDVCKCFSDLAMCVAISVIMVSPLHPDLPCLPVAVLPTCLCFTKCDIEAHWSHIWDLYSKTIGKVFNYAYPLGVGSDGCSTRVPLQLETMKLVSVLPPESGRGRGRKVYLPTIDRFVFNHHAIGLGGLKAALGAPSSDESVIAITNIHQQDPHHCMKKFMNCADSGHRHLLLGNNLVTLNVNYSVIAGADDTIDNPVSRADIERKDRMKVRMALNQVRIKAQSKIEEVLVSESNLNGSSIKASLSYLKMVFRYHMMNHSCCVGKAAVGLPLSTRVKFCGYTIGYLFGWLHWIRQEIKKKGSGITLKNFVTMQCFRDAIISCNSWLLALLVIRDRTALDKFVSSRLGSDCCETFFSCLSGFGGIEAGKRDASLAEIYRLADNMLTIMSWSGDPQQGKILEYKRTANHDLDRDHLLEDEKLMLENREKYGVIGVVGETPQDLTDERICAALEEGINEAKHVLTENGAFTDDLNSKVAWFDYALVNYKVTVSKENLGGEEGGDEGDIEDLPDIPLADLPTQPVREEGHNDELQFEIEANDIGSGSVDSLVPTSNSLDDSNYPPYGDDVLPLTREQVGEAIELDDVDNLVAISALGVVLDDVNNEDSPSINRAPNELRKSSRDSWLIKDSNAKVYDARTVVGFFSRLHKYKGAAWSRDRKEKIIKQRLNANISHELTGPKQIDEGQFRTGQFVAFHFFELDSRKRPVKPNLPRVYIGLVEKIVKRKSKSSATIMREPFYIGKVAEDIKCVVAWLKPILPDGENNVLKARRYIWMPPNQRKQHRGEFSAKIAFYVPDMLPTEDGSYMIDVQQAEAMESRYEGYNFATAGGNSNAEDHNLKDNIEEDVDDEDLDDM